MPTIDYAALRQTMIDTQLKPAGVQDEALLTAFEAVPREIFVDEGLKSLSYCDQGLCCGGHTMLEPAVHAKLLQAADIQPYDIVLDIGTGCGYSAALLAKMAMTVFALDTAINTAAQEKWNALDVCNIVAVDGDLTQGCAKHAPYSLIILNGAVSHIPQALVAQLGPEGRLLTILKDNEHCQGCAVIVQKTSDSTAGHACAPRPLFDAHAPYLDGFEPTETFCFG